MDQLQDSGKGARPKARSKQLNDIENTFDEFSF